MNGLTELYKAYINEFKKSKRSSAFWLSFVGVLSIVGIFFLIRVLKFEHFIPGENINPWDKLITDNLMVVGSFFLPFFVILLTALFVQIEHRTNMWKHLKVMPFNFSAIYYGKILAILTYIVATHFFFILMLLLSGIVSGIIHPELKYLEFSPDLLMIITEISKYVISSLGILIIQYWLSMRTKSFVLPIGVGLVSVIATLILIRGWEDIIYFPYAYSTLISYSGRGMIKLEKFWGFTNVSIFSVIYFVFLSILSYFDLRRIEVK